MRRRWSSFMGICTWLRYFEPVGSWCCVSGYISGFCFTLYMRFDSDISVRMQVRKFVVSFSILLVHAIRITSSLSRKGGARCLPCYVWLHWNYGVACTMFCNIWGTSDMPWFSLGCVVVESVASSYGFKVCWSRTYLRWYFCNRLLFSAVTHLVGVVCEKFSLLCRGHGCW